MKLISVYSISCFIFCSGVRAQVPVQDEPRHKVVLKNEYLRLLDGRIPANDTTLMHIHAANSVVVFLSKSKFGIQNVGEKPVIAEVSPGEAVYRAYGDKPVNHKVWDESATMFHFWVAELAKQHLGSNACSALSSTGADLQWQEKLVSAYRLRIDRGNHINLPKSNCAYLLMAISGVTLVGLPGSVRSLHVGNFFFFPPLSEIQINSGSQDTAACVLLEIK
jgi:hypothetical protein